MRQEQAVNDHSFEAVEAVKAKIANQSKVYQSIVCTPYDDSFKIQSAEEG